MQTFTGTEYLKIDIANTFGLDRLNWNNRLHWFQDNEPVLESLAIYAKNTILYRKSVRAMRKVQKGETTNHIMGLDATASGLQIMACLSGCHNTARATNLIPLDDRQCVYDRVAQMMNMEEGVITTRDEVKKPVMVTFYGSTAKPKEIFGAGPALIAFYRTLETMLGGAYELMGIFQEYWNPSAEYHQWTLPDGHVARVPVTEIVEKSLEIDEYAHMRFAYRTQVIQPQPRSRSLAANIVHSIDGWVVRQMVRAAHQGGYWMAPIHDCFYTSPNNMNDVREAYRTILAWIADHNLVSKILTEIAGHPVPYGRRSTNLSLFIGNSEYALS